MFLCVFRVCLHKTDIDAAREIIFHIIHISFQLLSKTDQCALLSLTVSPLLLRNYPSVPVNIYAYNAIYA